MSTRFVQRPYAKVDSDRLEAAGLARPLAQALAARGIHSPEDLLEDWPSLLAPQRLEGTQEMAQALADAIINQKSLTVVADYDCDGATACAIAIKGLRALGMKNVHYIVPDRFTMGYGLTPAIVDLVHEKFHPDIIMTVDNGIASVDGVERATALGMEVLITDHHLPGDTYPKARCIVNPNMHESIFPSKSLAGCGVMFYVLLAVRTEMRNRGIFTVQTQPQLNFLTDLVALGTVADVVKLDQNNRILVSQGLKRLRKGLGCPGLLALYSVAGRDPAVATERDFAFAIGPRINAAGRLTEMSVGIECLLADNIEQAQALAQELDNLNKERRDLEGSMQHDALDFISHIQWEKQCTITLHQHDWHAGVVGLVASRVKEKTHRPVIAFALDDNQMLKGSGRSIEGIHLRDALDLVSKCEPDLIERFGGHAMAAGLTIKAENLERFSQAFEACVKQMANPEVFERTVYIDGALSPDEITGDLVESLQNRIWGQGFEKPLYANSFRVVRQRILKDTHLKLLLALCDNTYFEAIFFRRNTPLPETVRLAYRPEINEFMGRRSIQLVVEAVED